MSEEYVEILRESRGISVDRTSAQQQIVIQYKIPDDATPNSTRALFMGDDEDVIALEMAYTILPVGRWLPSSDGFDVFLVISSIKIEQVNNYGWYKATAEYKFDVNTGEGGDRGEDPSAPTLPFVKIGFSVGSRTKTITQSLEVVSRTQVIGPLIRPLPDELIVGNTIGASEDGISGAEVYASGLTLQITAYYFPQYVNFALLNLFAEYFPCVNSDVFLGYDPGEALILGCDGSATVNDIVPITFTVEIKKNVDNQPDPPFPNLTCTGHSILDYRYVKELEGDAQMLTQLPVYRIVHRGYESKPLAALGFPTS